jgi:hypothetical protein
MNTLFPIIRRNRRPLIIEDVPPIPIQTAPVQPVVVLADGHRVDPAKTTTPDDAKIPATSESE